MLSLRHRNGTALVVNIVGEEGLDFIQVHAG